VLGFRVRLAHESVTLPELGRQRVEYLRQRSIKRGSTLPARAPNYCSGCPHNVSTLLAPGQRAWGAPGCHLFATLMDDPQKRVEATTRLGGEGLPWLGLAPYTSRPHIMMVKGVAQPAVTMAHIFRAVLPYVAMSAPVLAAMFFYPPIATW